MANTTPPLFGTAADVARRLAFSTVAGAFMGVTGGFGTFVDSPLQTRLVAWVAMFWAGTALYTLSIGPAVALGRRLGLPMWFSVGVALVLASIPMTAITYLAVGGIMHSGEHQPWLERYLQVLLVVTVFVGGYVAVHNMLGRGSLAQPPAAPATPPEPQPAPPPFLARLPARVGKDLLCLEMEDHYVRAHTALGSDLILMRMRDAVAELEGVEGMQTHRSWWVARAAVDSVEREGAAIRLKLRNGLLVPVARSTVADLRAAGWLN